MRGFTLLECLIYVTLFSLIMSGAVIGFADLTESTARNQTQAFLETEGTFLMEKIGYEIGHAQSMSEPSAVSSTSTELQLVSATGSTIEMTNNDGALTRTENSESLPLSNNSLQVTNLEFIYAQDDPVNPAATEIQVTLRLAATSSSGKPLSESFSESSYIFP